MTRSHASQIAASRFKFNLNCLIARTRLTQRAFAEQAGVPYSWVRKACSIGIARPHPDNEEILQNVRTFCDLGQNESLWGLKVPSSDRVKIDDLKDEHRVVVDDLEWMIQKFSRDRNVAEVKRAISEVAEGYRQQQAPSHDVIVKQEPKPRLSKAMPRSERFRANLRHLIEATGMTQKLFSDRLNLPYKWLRKSCNDGIAQVHPRNVEHLNVICDFFNLKSLETLWEIGIVAKRIETTDDIDGEKNKLVADLIWLLREFDETSDARKRFQIKEVRRVIAAVSKHLYTPEDRPVPQEQRKSISLEELTSRLDRYFLSDPASESAIPSSPKEPERVFGTPSRNVRAKERNRRGQFYTDDVEDLDEQIDRSMAMQSSRQLTETFSNIEAEAAESEAWWDNPAIQDAQHLQRLATAIIECLPESVTASFDSHDLNSAVSRMLCRGEPLDHMWMVFGFIDRMPANLKTVFTSEELTKIIEHHDAVGTSSRVLRAELIKLGKLRGVVADAEMLKRQKRIRRRKIGHPRR